MIFHWSPGIKNINILRNYLVDQRKFWMLVHQCMTQAWGRKSKEAIFVIALSMIIKTKQKWFKTAYILF